MELAMTRNVGGIDRILRIVLGLVADRRGRHRHRRSWWGLIGIVPVLTGAFRFCPAYPLLGLNTCPMEKR